MTTLDLLLKKIVCLSESFNLLVLCLYLAFMLLLLKKQESDNIRKGY